MKIENKPVQQRDIDAKRFQTFVAALGKLKPGQSFLVDALPANYRTAISVAQTLLGRQYATAREGDAYRVGLVET
jgi:hypothetical protein